MDVHSDRALADNELRVVTKLCRPPTHENIVSVLQHGYLQNESYVFFDMELCQSTLETYIRRDWNTTIYEKMQHLTIRGPPKSRMRDVMHIMMQIAEGTSYIHRHKEIHRDLKPSNSISVLSMKSLTPSPLLPRRGCVEDR